MKKSDIERIEEAIDRQIWGRGISGGQKSKKEHHGKKTQRVIWRAAAAAGQAKRLEKARVAIHTITDQLVHIDEKEGTNRQMDAYTRWLTESLLHENHIYNEDDIKRRTYTSGGHGGTGRQTSRNAWDIIHTPTGIRVTSEDSRLAGKNWEVGERELIRRLRQHLDSWRILGKSQVHAILGI